MGAWLRRLIVAVLVVAAALWLGSSTGIDDAPAGDPTSGVPSDLQAAQVTQVVEGDTRRVGGA